VNQPSGGSSLNAPVLYSLNARSIFLNLLLVMVVFSGFMELLGGLKHLRHVEFYDGWVNTDGQASGYY